MDANNLMKPNHILSRTVLFLSLVGLLVTSARAVAIYDVSSLAPTDVFPGANNGNGYSYDYDVTTGDEGGSLKDLLLTNMSNGGLTATVTWSPTGSLAFTEIYLKAGGGGRSGGGYMVWDVSGVDWSIYDGFSITNEVFLNQNGGALGISHFNAVGTEVPNEKVPDAGTSAILVGLGLISLGVFRKLV
jgi:hypothetical protein